ncbi:MAG: UDP-N-acetylmuramoyl-tripeptide--D-alanyl-D-alanine ligase [Lachnospiraceae bacterium]|nr:UDP-N-acetylmuramoyl-tripeptide--D-alanyl-D-alanine ligase [Lachnospiraceae bacterium]
MLTVQSIALACNGKIVNGEGFEDKKIAGAAIDSRKVEKGFLFFAFKGEKTDGHDYIKSAFDNGALAVVCERVPEGEDGICIVVEDTIKALRSVARYYRESLSIKVVGVTGSIGKTTTKEFIATVLSQKYSVYKTDKNQNNLIGLPLSILNIKENNEIAVLEMGISEFGEMTILSEMAKPDICVITNISECHLETLGSLDGVFKAKTEIFEHMKEDGCVVVCGDDERLAKIEDVKGKKPVKYGFDEKNDVHPVKVLNRGLWGSECTVQDKDGIFGISIPLAGKHMVYDALAAVSVAKILNLSAEDISFGISCVKAIQGRNNIIQKNGITIIDDCYNASPESMKSALDLLTEAVTPTVAILGDMYEQGENEDKSHEEIGEYAAKKEINTIVCVGPLSKKMYDKAFTAAADKEFTNVIYFESVDETIEKLDTFIKKDDTVLLKASNGMKFSRILDALMNEDKKDSFTKREEKLFKNTSFGTDDSTIGNIINLGKNAETATEGAASTETVTETEEKGKKNKKAADGQTLTSDQKEKKSAKKQLIAILIAVCAVIVIVTAAVGIIKANEYKRITSGEVVFRTSQGYCTKGLIEDNVIIAAGENVAKDPDNYQNPAIHYDGKNFYFEIDNGQAKILKVCTSNGKGAKDIAENVQKYETLGKNKLLYKVNDNLYLYNAKKNDTELLSQNVRSYYRNGSNIIFETYDVKIYQMKVNSKESIKLIEENITALLHVNEKQTGIIYSKDGALCMNKKGKKTVTITTDSISYYFPANSEKSKVYFEDGSKDLWYFGENSFKARKVSDDCKKMMGKEFNEAAFIMRKGDGTFYLIKDGSALKINGIDDADPKEVVGIDSKGKKLYFTARSKENGATNLYSVSYKGIGFSKTAVCVDSNIENVEYIGNKKVFVTKNDGSGLLDLYCNEKLVARNVSTGSVKKTAYGNNYVFAYQVKDVDGFYKINLYNGKDVKEIGSSVDLDYVPVTKKKVYLRNMGTNMFAVSVYNGRKAKVYKDGIDEFGFYFVNEEE